MTWLDFLLAISAFSLLVVVPLSLIETIRSDHSDGEESS